MPNKKRKLFVRNEKDAIMIISRLSEVKKDQKYIDSLSKHKKGVSYMIENEKINGKDCYRIKEGYSDEFHWDTYTIFYINKNDCSKIYVDDVLSGDMITLQQWRKQQSKN